MKPPWREQIEGREAQEAHPQPCTGPALEKELLVDSAATDQ